METKYFEGIGKRKSAVARVRITQASKSSVEINSKSLHDYFPVEENQVVAMRPLGASGLVQKYKITVKVKGGGISSQAEAVSLGLARAIILFDGTVRVPLKRVGLLTRNARIKERRKFGLKKARKAPQWRKR